MPNHWNISPTMHHEMAQVARQFRKLPTKSEALLWQELRGRQINGVKFRRQQPIGPFVVDFFAAAHKLVVEVDGLIHDQQQEADRRRQDLLESLGLRFLRVTSAEVEMRLEDVLLRIREALNPHPPAPSPKMREGEPESR